MNHRLFVTAPVSLALLLTACGGDDTTPLSAEPGETTRTIEHFSGTTEVPVDPQRIVTLQDQNAMLPLLELGVTPIASYGREADDGTTTFRRVQGYDTSDVVGLGDFLEPDLEAIAAQRPDLIIADELGGDELFDELSRIAPTVVVQVFDRPLTEALEDFAAVVGREDRAAELRAEYEARIEQFRESLGDDLDRTSVSLLAGGEAGTFFQADGGQAQGTVMMDLGLLRPEPQREPFGTDTEFSLEQLPEHDADAVFVVAFGGEEDDPGAIEIVDSGLWAGLAATQAGQSSTIDGTESVGSAWGKMDVFLDQLEDVLLSDDFDPDVVQENA